MKNVLEGKKGLIIGLSNDKGIAYAIAESFVNQGAEIAVSHEEGALGKRAIPLAEKLGAKVVVPCDATNQEQMEDLFSAVKKEYGKIDFIVHSIAYSDKNELKGMYLNTTESNFLNTMNISCYSFTKAAQIAYNMDILNENASLMTMSYLGAERHIPNYNVMGVAKAALEASVRYLAVDLGTIGVRVNSISAGPIKTLAASGIGEFRKVLSYNEANAPLCKNITAKDVANSALYLASDMSTGISGENLHVDAGFHIMGMSKTLSI
ncbi:MAG: enoyl-ACP reductase [Proteobacteria bacterium]|nr:enoyl-ACP reductase [Pseudomonadota bacterium]